MQEYVTEETKAYMEEIWEEKFIIDITGGIVSMISVDTCLRTGRSRQARLVLQECLKKAQSVLRIKRKNSWIQVSVLIDSEAQTGWIEKTKVVHP